jgi:hypothetical protein
MKPIPSTAEILAFKALDRAIDQTWIDWAYEMLEAGCETESLVILAGELKPYNQFELQSLTDKIFIELNLNWDNREQTLKNYVCYLVDKALNGKIKFVDVLDLIKDMYIELDNESSLSGFYMLYYAYDDLKYSEHQWYWDGATRENIDEMAKDYFIEWKANSAFTSTE